MQQPLTFNLDFQHRPFFRTMALINRQSEDALDADTLEVLKHQFVDIYGKNKDRIKDKVWKKNDMLLDLFDYIVSQFNKQPMREGYNFTIEGRLDYSDRHSHSFPLQTRIVPIQHNNLIVPLNWILRQKKNESVFDSLVMAFHHLFKVVGDPEQNEPRIDNIWSILDDRKEEIPKELYRRTEYWYGKGRENFKNCKVGEFMDVIQYHPERLLHRAEGKNLSWQQTQMRLNNKIDKTKDIWLKSVIKCTAELLEVCKYETTVINHCSILDFDTENGWPNTGMDLTEYIFDPYDFFGMSILEDFEDINNNIGSVGLSYWSNLFYPKPDSYFDSGFLELFIDKTQQLQKAIYGLYKHQIYQYDKCPQWF